MVLVVDDRAGAREALHVLLEIWGHTVRDAPDGAKALTAALAWQPDVVCLDTVLPDMTGYQLAAQIRAAFGEAAPVLIAIAGLGHDVDRPRALAAGCNECLVEPYEIADLHEVVSSSRRLPPRAALPAAILRTKTA